MLNWGAEIYLNTKIQGGHLEKPASTLPELDTDKSKVLYSSSEIKDNINKSGNQITDAENDLLGRD